MPIGWITYGAITGRPLGNVVLVSGVMPFVGFYLPTDADIPLRRWVKDREERRQLD